MLNSSLTTIKSDAGDKEHFCSRIFQLTPRDKETIFLGWQALDPELFC